MSVVTRVTIEPDPISVSVQEAAKLANVSAWTIYQLLGSGAIEGRYLGRKRLVLFASLKSYIEGLPEDAPEAS